MDGLCFFSRTIVLEPGLEYELRGRITKEPDGESLAVPPERAAELIRQIGEAWQAAAEKGKDGMVCLCDPLLRPHLAAMLARQIPQLPVLAYDEIAIEAQVESVATVSLQGQEATAALAANA